MGLLSGFNVTVLEIEILGQAARAAFSGAAIPNDWSVLTPQELGVAPQYWDGLYFTNNGASAIVLQQGNAIIVSFRGTDSEQDFAYYPELLFGTYINRFEPLLTAITAQEGALHFYFTGASLGGGAVNQMADIASYQYAGRFAAAQFVAFASPTIANANGILNFGFENDPIYKVLENYSDQPSSLDNLVLATAEYMAGNYDGRHPLDYYAHSSSAFDVIGRLKDSAFYDFMSPDSVLIFDAYSGPVTDLTPGRESSGAFYLGEAVADQIIGRAGDDFIEGFAGDDTLSGAAGNDRLDGGAGNDIMVGDTGNDILDGGGGLDQLTGDGGYDTFVFAAGEADGDEVLDFSGNGALAGDSFRFVGFGTAAGGATFTQIGATQWQIHSGRDGHNEVITLPYGASVHTSDYVFQDALGNSAPVATAGDFNGDSKADILWQHDSGLPVIWTMDGTTITNSSTLPNPEGPAWHVAATSDFNGDGKSDLLLQNADSGLPSIWTMDGTTLTNGAALPNPGAPAWHVVAAADFNGDGKSDILLQNADSGLPSIWTMDGTTLTNGAALPNPGGPAWYIAATADFSDDGKSDILLQNA